MRIKHIAAALLLCLLLLSGCTAKSQPIPAGMEAADVIADAMEVAQELGEGAYQAVFDRLRADVAQSLTVEDVAALLPSSDKWVGVSASSVSGQTDKKSGETYEMAKLTCLFESGERLIYVGFDTQGNLIGLRVTKE